MAIPVPLLPYAQPSCGGKKNTLTKLVLSLVSQSWCGINWGKFQECANTNCSVSFSVDCCHLDKGTLEMLLILNCTEIITWVA